MLLLHIRSLLEASPNTLFLMHGLDKDRTVGTFLHDLADGTLRMTCGKFVYAWPGKDRTFCTDQISVNIQTGVLEVRPADDRDAADAWYAIRDLVKPEKLELRLAWSARLEASWMIDLTYDSGKCIPKDKLIHFHIGPFYKVHRDGSCHADWQDVVDMRVCKFTSTWMDRWLWVFLGTGIGVGVLMIALGIVGLVLWLSWRKKGRPRCILDSEVPAGINPPAIKPIEMLMLLS